MVCIASVVLDSGKLTISVIVSMSFCLLSMLSSLSVRYPNC
jgi:hypothetical protein